MNPRQHRAAAHPHSLRRTAAWLLVLGVCILGTTGIWGATITPIQYFYVPIPETEFRTYANAQTNSVENDLQRSVISITATYNGTIVYYDQWEDGYEYDITSPTQSTSRIWGDNDASNGIPPGFATDVINAGNVITLQDDVPCNPRDPGNHFYDGRDKFASTEQLVVTHAMWPVGAPGDIGAMLAGAVEVFEVARWGTYYDIPVGTAIGGGFGWVALSIMSQADGTTVQVDADANGSYETTQTLNEGQTLFVPSPVARGARVLSSDPIQVNMLTCQSPSTYNGRLYPLIPTSLWGDYYYSPVPSTTEAGGTNVPCEVILFNPGAATITVTATTSSGSTNVNVGSRTTAIYTMPPNTGARFQSTGNPFYAVAAIDRNGPVHNWGFTLIPRTSLTTSVVAGWSPGTTNLARDASPLWVTPDAPVTIYVDYDGDPATGPNTDPEGNRYDVSYSLTALQSLRIFSPGPSYDHTGYRVYNTSNVKLAVVWGQDGANSSSGQVTELDLGTTVIPYPTVTAYKEADLIGDFNQDGGIDPGDVLLYTIRVHNSGIVPIDFINVIDTLDTQVTYVAGSTTMNGVDVPDGPGYSFPLAPPAGYDLPIPGGTLEPGDPDIIISFQVTVNSPFIGTEINNQVKVTSVAEIFLNALLTVADTGTLATTKTSNLPTPPGHFLPGDTVDYTVTIQNTSNVNQTGIRLDDPLPPGTSYVAQSTVVSGSREKMVRDVFDQLLFSNNDGPENWAGNWTESDGTQSPTAGNVQVTNGELRITGNNTWALRVVDLSAFSGGFASLRFTWRTNTSVDTGDTARIDISTNGSTWATLNTITGTAGARSGYLIFDISAYISATTYIRFYTTGYASPEFFYVDQVTVRAMGASITAHDLFTTAAYNNFTAEWATNWIEQDGRDGAQSSTAGNVLITGGELRIENRTYANQSASRTVNLVSPSTCAVAYLWFDVRGGGLQSGETAVVEVSADGTNFTVLGTFGTNSTTGIPQVFDISNFISATTTIRFRSVQIGGSNQNYSYFDNVRITAGRHLAVTKDNLPAGANADLLSGVPPTLLQQGDGFALAPGASMTVTYSVTVNSPVTTSRLVNTATATSWEKAPPASDTIIDPVKPGGTIGDLVWLDINNDGIPQVGEPGIANVRVWLDTNANGTYEAGTDAEFTTDANGRYVFSSLLPGTYQVYVDETTLPAGLDRVPGTPNPSGTITITSAGDEQFFDIDFGYTSELATGIIGDRVWSDYNNDGMLSPGEVGLPGVTMSLATDPGPDLAWGTPDDIIADTVTTLGNGEYFFTGVPSGSYRVLAGTGPDGVLGTADDDLAAYVPTVGPQSQGGRVSTAIDLDPAENINYIDFGFRNSTDASLTERFWFDMDSDGVADPGEPGLDGVTVNIFNPLGIMIGSGTTDANGSITFAGLADGTYTVQVEDAYGRLLGFGATTAEAAAGQASITIAGGSVSVVDFGYNAPGVIGDLVWSDANSNGVRDAGESGIDGIDVYLYQDVNGNGVYDVGTDPLVDSTQTDAGGWYRFEVSTAGRFFVSIPDQPGLTGATLTTPDDEAAAGAQIQVEFLNLTTGYLMADFGYKFGDRYAISGAVFNDLDASGTLDPGEPFFAGVTVDLIRPGTDGLFGTDDDIVAATAVTDANGEYIFQDLPDGSYRVQVTDTWLVLSGYQVSTGADYQDIPLAGADVTDILFGYHRFRPTRILLERFTAYRAGGCTVVEWETGAEFGTAGFDLYRLEGSGALVKANPSFLTGLLVAPRGGTYTFIDRGAPSSGSVTYLLVEREGRGGRNNYGPFTFQLQTVRGAAVPDQDYARVAHEPPVRSVMIEPDLAPRRSSAEIDGIRIDVTEDGICFIPASTIANLLGTTDIQVWKMIQRGRLALTCEGQPVPYQLATDPTGIWFFGRALTTNYTDRNAYQMTVGTGHRMSVEPQRPTSPADKTQAFGDSVRAEQDAYALRTLFTDPDTDFWTWDFVVADDAYDGLREFQVPTPAPSDRPGEAILSVYCIGMSDLPDVTDYHVRLFVNGTPVGEDRWNGTSPHRSRVNFPSELLQEGSNSIAIEGLLDPGVEYSIFFVDALEVSYDRQYVAAGDRLFLRGDGNSTVTVAGFTDPDIQVLDLTDPDNPVLLSGVLVDGTPGNYRVSFDPTSPDTIYLAWSRSGVQAPANLTVVPQNTLTSPANAAEYLIIAPSGMMEAAERFADYRRSRGLQVLTVDQQEVYDTFGYGLATPEAIRNFLAFARSNWQVPPRFLLLAGDGTYDPKNLEGFGDCLVTPFLVGTPDGIYASDQPLGDVDGDGLPEVAVGRIPALTPQDLDAAREKIEAYETAPGGSWTSTILLLADDPDDGGNFTANCQTIAGLLPTGYTTLEMYLAELGVDSTRSLLFDSLDDGAVLLNYVGHGGPMQLADERLLTHADLAGLGNSPRLPLLAAFTCSTGMFELPGFEVLGETALLQPGDGAVAVWSPTGLSLDSQAKILNEAIIRALFIDGRRPLGTALLQAQREFVERGGGQYMLNIYNLLGDPALELK